MRVHLIAIGGSAMHNFAIALHKKGYVVTGSDDEIFNPSKSRLEKYALLPEQWGWFPDKITKDIDIVILGMHAKADNPELLKAQELGVKVMSYPEYLYDQTKDKKRVVIGGSHGKTTITSMIMHVLNHLNIKHDYMVGALLDGFETMVELNDDNKIAIIEGDEYLSSPIDRRPKFHWYKPDVAILTGIAWDHINVFPTFDNYCEQFEIFVKSINKDGSLIWYQDDVELKKVAKFNNTNIGYDTLKYKIENNQTIILHNNKEIEINVFGKHNLQNINAARLACKKLNISDDDFFEAIKSFKGAAKRLQLIKKNDKTAFYIDFAHAPSKLKATCNAVKNQYKDFRIIACIELHTFSSLQKNFLPQYKNSMDIADEAIVYYNPKVIEHKKLEPISKKEIKEAFGGNVKVYSDTLELQKDLKSKDYKNTVLLMMSSGNFNGVNFNKLADELF